MNKHKQSLHELNRYYSIWRDSLSMYEEWSKAHGLTYNSVMALISIYENEGACTQKMIVDKWMIPKQTVNTILKGFEKQGLITFMPAAADKRSKLILFTPSGEEYAGKIVTKLLDLELSVMSQLGSERAKIMNDAFELYVELFHQEARNQNEQP